MPSSKIEAVLRTILPEAVYEISAPETGVDGQPLTRCVVYTPTGTRSVYCEGVPMLEVQQVTVTVVTQEEDDPLPGQIRAALAAAGDIAVGDPSPEYAEDSLTVYTDIPCEVI